VKRGYVRQLGDRVLLRVDDPLAALEKLGIAARARLPAEARVIAVTGSAGKTTTKEMLRACLSAIAPGQTHASEKSYNNHWGVPLTLARMPTDTRYAIFEIGMNHPGEIAPLSCMVRPHVAIITTVAAAHLAAFKSVEEIADAKAEIFEGLKWDDEPGKPKSPRVAVLPRDNEQFERLRAAAVVAEMKRVRLLSFGRSDGDVALEWEAVEDFRSMVAVRVPGRNNSIGYYVYFPGRHNIDNSMAVMAALVSVVGTGEFERACKAIGSLKATEGRGARLYLRSPTPNRTIVVLDESYNANPASMAAALGVLALNAPNGGRRIAVLGDMLELGASSGELHKELASPIAAAQVDIVLACGPMMKHLFDALPPAIQAKSLWKPTAIELIEPLLATVEGGDVVMIKGSNGMRLSALVEALKKRHSGVDPPG